MKRTILHRLARGLPVSKPDFVRTTGFPGRMVNAAIDSAKGHLAAVRAAAVAHVEDATEALTRALAHYLYAEEDSARKRELHGRRRNITRLTHRESRAQAQLEHPSVFFGRKEHENQYQDRNWKKAYLAKRSDHLSANGGADEAAGNSTLRVSLGPVEMIDKRLWQWFKLRHEGKHLGRFRLQENQCQEFTQVVRANQATRSFAMVEVWFDAAGKKISPLRQKKMEEAKIEPVKKRLIRRAVTVNRVGLTIDLKKTEGRNRWYIHISRKASVAPTYVPASQIGVDLNCVSLDWGHIVFKDGQPVLEGYKKCLFPANGPTGPRKMAFFTAVNDVVARAKAASAGICLEYLEFESCKRWLTTKLGSMLRVMPYRQIRAAFERRCLEQGVPFRLVPPKYTSLIGAAMSQRWPKLGRDQAAGVVLALRASAEGNRWLEQTCEQVVRTERVLLRFNAKNKFGHSAMLTTPPSSACTSTDTTGHQREHPRYPVEPALFWQVAAGRKIKDGFSSLSGELRKRRRAAKAQKCAHSPPHFKMPHQIELPCGFIPMLQPTANESPGSSLHKVA
jgi:hypothetical protein